MSENALFDKWKSMISRLRDTWDEITEIKSEKEDKTRTSSKKSIEERNAIMKNQTIITAVILTSLLAGCDVIKDRETAGQYVDDAGITASISSAIIADPALSKFDIHVETLNNEVQLSGFVKTHEQARHAESIARDILNRNVSRNAKHPSIVRNNLKVRP